MSANPRRRRAAGSLGDLKRYLWAVVCYNLDVVEEPTHPHDLRQRAGNALVQAGMAYLKATEQTALEQRIRALELAAERNGHNEFP